MNEKRLFFDHDCADKQLIRQMERRGFDCMAAEPLGLRSAADEDILRLAATEQRVLISGNRRDFEKLHADWMKRDLHHAGIVLVHQHLDLRSRPRRLNTLFAAMDEAVIADRLVYLNSWPEE